MTVSIEPASRVPFDDIAAVFGDRGGAAHCWCQWFKQPNRVWERSTDDERRVGLIEQQGDDPGLVLRLDGEPVGWVGVERKGCYPRLATGLTARGSVDAFDDPGVWSVTCFVVRTGSRRRGLAGELLRAAVEHTRARGARVLEAYPVEVQPGARTPSSNLYHGTLSMFLAEGFEVVARPSTGRAVVRLELAGARFPGR
ncbi:GNAT family N-acetyltransferase [Galbitalea sp. SE-J8]|uniref:GNAT family N-acetyltransferase n=1 Tax=Galbitalea sp. SE-J8 TaxID=3054952 RepID=UPI00259D181E|nr:GNAT family N-acetyltransferase [Galbitalea sp. SE-J8]MDM4763168.1 GNAT family N-acetyltransferase [Galbitalea sp. SE-J8]